MFQCVLGLIACHAFANPSPDPYVFGTPVIEFEVDAAVLPGSIYDADGDGIVDIVAAGDAISFLAGKGDGAFEDPVHTHISPNTIHAQMRDVDGDGIPDFVIFDELADAVVIAYGDGAGGFEVSSFPAEAISASGFGVADLDGDGILDLAAADLSTARLLIFRGLGDRAFAEPSTKFAHDYGVGKGLAIADVTQDGHLDIVTAGRKWCLIYEGNGDGTFDNLRWFDVGTHVTGFALDDFNDDGLPDLAFSEMACECLLVRLADGRGGFGVSKFLTGFVPLAMSYADFDTDGVNDFLLRSDSRTSVHLNKLDGVPKLSREIDTLAIKGVADVNGDGFADLYGEPVLEAVTIAFHNGVDGWDLPINSPTPGSTGRLALPDVDGDDIVDLAIVHSDGLWLATGNGDGTFGAFADVAGVPPNPIDFHWIHFNDDGHLDLAVLLGNGNLVTYLGAGDGTFTQIATFATSFDALLLKMEDVSGDGVVDAVVGAHYNHLIVTVLHGIGSGLFEFADAIVFSDSVRHFDFADVDGSLGPDLVIVGRDELDVGLYLNDGAGYYSHAYSVPVSAFIVDIASTDLDEDGAEDLLLSRSSIKTLTVLYNDDGQLGDMLHVEFEGNVRAARSDDVNGDGNSELLVLVGSGMYVGDDKLAEWDRYQTLNGRTFSLTDVDNDGWRDLVTLHKQSVTVLLNRSGRTGCTIDVNGDGVINILDFVFFQLAWDDEDPIADCDGNEQFDILDFVCFQQLYQAGCD